MSEPSQNGNSATEAGPFGIEAALLLALLTASTYIVAYRYESSYCEHFGIPESYIRVSPEILTSSFLSIAAFAVSVFWTIHIVIAFVVRRRRDPNNFAHVVLVSHAIIACIGLIGGLAYGFSWPGVAIFVAVVIAFDCIVVVWAFAADAIGKFWKGTFPRAVPAEVPPDAKIDGFILVFRYVKFRYLAAAFAVWVVSVIADFAGIQSARQQRRFTEIRNADLVIVRTYGDYTICKQLLGENLGAATFIMKIDSLLNDPMVLHVFKKPPEIEKTYRPTPRITDRTI